MGLPWANLWPAVTSALSGRRYAKEDVDWVLDRAGSFVVETLEGERSVCRLYHQALADHLREGREKTETQRRIAEALIETVPGLPDSGGKDWRLAHSYLRAHLAEHAAACGMFDGLAKDPLFLLAADPDRLLAVMETHPEEVPPQIARVYQGAFHQLKTKPLSEGASYLEMEARISKLTEFADQVAQLPLPATWHVPCAQWLPVSTHRILTQSTSPVRSLAVAQRQGRTVIVSAGGDGSIYLWDLERGEAVGAPLIGQTLAVYALAVAERQGRTVIVSGSWDQSIRLWDLASGGLLLTVELGAPVYSLVFGGASDLVVGAQMGLLAVRLDD